MGGICAILGEPGDPELGERLGRMLDRSPYRGEIERHLEDGLAIGIQTMGWDASLHSAGNWLVAFHGYIGNWNELAPAQGLDLPADATNAHRIAIAYEALGDGLFARLRGEFALLILDRHRRELVAVRDLVGCRPLFHHLAEERLFVASEVRQMLAGSGATPELDHSTMVRHLLIQPPVGALTFHRGLHKVLPPSVVRFSVVDPSRPSEGSIYWHPPAASKESVDIDDAARRLRQVLARAVKRATPDRPFAVALGGGLDSGSIWALIADQQRAGDEAALRGRPYSLCFPGLWCDETDLIRAILEATEADGELIDASAISAFDSYAALATALDQPFGATMYDVTVLCNAALESDRRVLLTGLGGDEWLGGTYNYLLDELRRGRISTVLRDARTLEVPSGTNRFWHILTHGFSPGWGILGWLGQRAKPPWLAPSWWPPKRATAGVDHKAQRRGATRSQQALLGMLSYHQHAFVLGGLEHCAATFGTEVRNPLMDQDLIELSMALPGRALIAGSQKKQLLRTAIQGLLPTQVLEHPKTPPRDEIMARDWPEFVAAASGTPWNLIEEGILDAQGLDKILHCNTLGMYEKAGVIDPVYICELVSRASHRRA
jgi:asparagine synthase (glutamine-hydrolysing)